MRRSMTFCLIAVMLLVATTASAQWYVGLRLAGTDSEIPVEYYMYGGRDFIGGDNDGVIDNTTMTFGYALEAMDLELSFGYDSDKASYEFSGGTRDTWDETYSRYTFALAGLYHLGGTESFVLDGGLRLELTSEKILYEEDYSGRADYTDELTFSGWGFGPVFRGRYFFGDGHLAFGPEMYIKYQSRTLKEEWGYDTMMSDEMDFTGIHFDYALRLDFLF